MYLNLDDGGLSSWLCALAYRPGGMAHVRQRGTSVELLSGDRPGHASRRGFLLY